MNAHDLTWGAEGAGGGRARSENDEGDLHDVWDEEEATPGMGAGPDAF